MTDETGKMAVTATARQRTEDGAVSPDNTDEKQRGRPFEKGTSGNPSGRPRGSRNATTLALEVLLDGQAKALTQKAIDLALTGEMAALRLCIERLMPPRKDSPVNFTLPPMKASADAVAAGELTPMEAGELTKMVQAFAKVIETADLEERINRLEGMATK